MCQKEKKINLLLATHNKNKYKEFSELLKNTDVKLKSLLDFTEEKPEENGTSFKNNAFIKANSAFNLINFKISCMSDDSGLVIDQLNGAPGIFSARWALKGNYNLAFDQIKNKLYEKGLEINNQKAKFVCVLAYIKKRNDCRYYRGELKGSLTYPPRGSAGFGYDPIFVPDGYNNTLSELSEEEKNNISHRKVAVSKFIINEL